MWLLLADKCHAIHTDNVKEFRILPNDDCSKWEIVADPGNHIVAWRQFKDDAIRDLHQLVSKMNGWGQ